MLTASDTPITARPGCPKPHKRSYTTRGLARDHARELRRKGNKGIREYLCPCGNWHVGRMPKETRTGTRTAAEVYAARARKAAQVPA